MTHPPVHHPLGLLYQHAPAPAQANEDRLHDAEHLRAPLLGRGACALVRAQELQEAGLRAQLLQESYRALQDKFMRLSAALPLLTGSNPSPSIHVPLPAAATTAAGTSLGRNPR